MTFKTVTKVSFKVFCVGYEFYLNHDIELEDLEFIDNGRSVDVFVRRE